MDLVAPPSERVLADVRIALAEDVGPGDLTAHLLDAESQLETRVICRERAIFCGRPWFDAVFASLDMDLRVDWSVKDGDALTPGLEVCRVSGPARSLLTGERTALNFIQTLSGTATRTRAFAQKLEGLSTHLLDTRKTLPGLRQAQKYAVRCGGAHNHRMGLYDAILIKENHINAAGTITQAVERAVEENPGVLVEVEVENITQLREAHQAGATRALLDNFDLPGLREAVQELGGRMELEASGDVQLDTVRGIAETGVDFISTGAITKHVQAVDFSMRFID